MNDREQNSSQSNKHNKPSACWCRVAKLLYLNPPLSCLQEGEAEEKQLEGQREVLQKAQVKRKRYEGVLAQFWNSNIDQHCLARQINITKQLGKAKSENFSEDKQELEAVVVTMPCSRCQ